MPRPSRWGRHAGCSGRSCRHATAVPCGSRPTARRAAMRARSALVVANDEYADPGLARLRSPGQDAAALAEVLGDPDVGQFDVEIVRNGSVQLLRERLDEFFGSAGPGDELLVHFSCFSLKAAT